MATLCAGGDRGAMATGFELGGWTIDGTRPAKAYEAFTAAHHPMGGSLGTSRIEVTRTLLDGYEQSPVGLGKSGRGQW